MKRTIITSISFLLMAGVVLLFAGTGAAETIELKFSTSFSPKHTQQVKVFEPWAEKINELTDGQVKVNFFPGGALGKAGDQVDLVKSGIADITYTLHDYTPGRFPLTSVFELPFMVPSGPRTSWAMWKMFEEVPEFQKEYKDFKVLSLFCHPGGNFNTVDKPIKSLEDFKGMKIRTASPSVTKALKTFGATPVNMPVTETYTAMERGVVDGTVLPWEGLFVFNLYELTSYCVES
ncbi:MAG: TRAP transporter substrate-binding protein, partial [Desulfobacteraceae bacterium]|nr:TRAP transporter substrate-binding protein [Desulfobacteraceae bacterium]